MVYFELVKVTINASSLIEVIINIVMRYCGLSDLIVINRGLLFTSKLWSLLCYFFSIQQRFSTAFYPQTNNLTKRQKSTIEIYLQVFINFDQNDWIWLLSMAKFVYNNIKNISTGHTLFKLNCGYHLLMSYKEDLNLCSKSKITEDLSFKLQNLIANCQ